MSTTASEIRDQLLKGVLPWWLENGIDRKDGGVFTCFSNSGRLLSNEKYTWSQGRWAWLCSRIALDSEAGIIGEDPRLWATLSIETARFIQAHAILDGGVTAYRTSAAGQPLPSGPHGEIAVSVLADLFAALGLAGAARLPQAAAREREEWLHSAHALLAHAEERIEARSAPSEPYPVRAGFKDAAGLMLLLNVGAQLHLASGSAESAQTAGAALSRLLGDANSEGMWKAGSWWEYRPDSADDLDTLLARHRTPGHLLEMLWMVMEAVEIMPDLAPRIPDWLPDLAVRALEAGWDDQHGGIFRYVDSTGTEPRGRLLGNDPYETLVTQTWDTKLWWVQVEALYASRLLAERFVRPELLDWHERIWSYTLDTFPDPSGQEWLQIRDREGKPLDKVVALPVKDPFHIARSLLLTTELETRRTHT
ncbi:AGE family epimerase/isomerase [Arthrobacter bambusae]|jgi:N-acylglucosamine 2-epimerase|uniref:AGE family epimerase/isomerase n=1 Tax=Arthrobacter TaxID=1663 RepID=UPI001F50AA0C|nr:MULTISPECIES: AGE family epimerase/isomerase [Arthrobacter]MCI0142724.1 AGE family epimerase/isomerase [Arthrobacter bambusae]UYY82005.1 AGE family epimerase/isomerase [Arthrobacter sp. YA7-1]